MDLTLPTTRAANVARVPRKKRNKVMLAARVSEAEFKALEEMAACDQITMTELMRQWLRTLPTYHPAPLRPLHREKEGR